MKTPRMITLNELNDTARDNDLRNALVIIVDSFNTWLRNVVGRGAERSRTEVLGAFLNRLKKEFYSIGVSNVTFKTYNVGEFEFDINTFRLCKLNFIHGRFTDSYIKLLFAKLNSFVPSVLSSIPAESSSSYDDIFNNFYNQLKTILPS